MVKIRKKSSRQPTRLREKIKKKVREHKRKKRKEDKRNPHPQRKKKDIGVPNSLPFKETILKEAEDRKRRLEEERQQQKEKRKQEREQLLLQKRGLAGLVKDAEKKTENYEKKQGNLTKKQLEKKNLEGSLKAYYKEFRKVVDAADVVLEVLDARDPLGSRCRDLEETVLSSGTNKRLVLILNKIDLVPRENVDAWLKYLKNEFPVVAFKASTQSQNSHLCQSKGFKKSVTRDKVEDLMKTSNCLGADTLMKLLANYCRNKDIKTVIRVGVVGLPNTGKSSIINSLKRSKACHVGGTPGVTKQMQEVQIDKHIRLLDSPGVVMSHGHSDTAVILRNCVKLESLQDCTEPVEAIIKRCSKKQLMLHYCLPNFDDVQEFLSLLAKRQGRFRKGGIPDVNRAARNILQDWNNGKLRYYTHPPEDREKSTHLSAEFVTQMGKEFDIDALLGEQQKVIDGLESTSTKHMEISSFGAPKIVMNPDEIRAVASQSHNADDDDVTMMNDDASYDDILEEEEEEREEEEEEAMEESEDEVGQITVSLPPSKPRSRTSSQSKDGKPASKKVTFAAGLPQLNKARKMDFKKMKKERKRRDKVASSLSDALSTAFSFGGKPQDRDDGMDGYNFDEHFK